VSTVGSRPSDGGVLDRERLLLDLRRMAARMRRNILQLAFAAGPLGAHVGPALSIVEICAVLYGAVMRLDPARPAWSERDRFLLSKGHGSLGLYTALAEVGFITGEELKTFEVPGSFLTGQPPMNVEKGLEIASGSLGLGLSIGVGIALAARMRNAVYRSFVLMGDGECNEGSVWEAAMSAAHFQLTNLIAVVDANGMQSDGPCTAVMDMGSHEDKWRSFGWDTAKVDGHDVGALYDAFTKRQDEARRPLAVIATTVKGKGVSFIESNNEWHHNRLSQQQLDAALMELGT